MSDALRAVRGFNDILPADVARWRFVESAAVSVLESAGYYEIRIPLVEHTALFERSIGESTDIVEKEMYTFDDRGGDSLSLRPEGTAGCVRAGIAHGLFGGSQQRLWYRGPMFRHERPQKGRYRQFHQIGAEAFGISGTLVEAELISLGDRLWRRLGIGTVQLSVNSLGSPADRLRYRQALVEYLEGHAAQLDEEDRRRLARNPLRILDSKNEGTHAVLVNAPRITDFLGAEARGRLDELSGHLGALEISHSVDPFLVRGLDYYTGVVFEWTTTALGAQDAICAGGRYDGLVETLGGRPTPAVGWALGMERVVLAVDAEVLGSGVPRPDAYFVALGEKAERRALVLGRQLRDELPELRIILNAGGGSLKAQLRRADKSGSRFAFILGEAELGAGTIAVKPLTGEGEQKSIAEPALIDYCRRVIGRVA